MDAKSLVIAGNNCFASRDAGDNEVLSSFDYAMLRPFLLAWGFGRCIILATDTPSLRPRTIRPEANVIVRQLSHRRTSRGVLRLVAMPALLMRMSALLRPGTYAYARLPSPAGACLVLASALRRRQIICSLHGLPRWWRAEPSWQSTLRLRRVYILASRFFMRRAVLVFATDPAITSVYGVRGAVPFSNTLLEYVPTVVPGPTVKIAPPVRLCILGRLSHEKNPLFAIDVAEELFRRGVDVQLTFIGDGPMAGQVDKRLMLSPCSIERLGWIEDRGRLLDQLAQMTFLLLPSFAEGSPKAPIEAMAVGTVVVTWRMNSAVIELCDDGAAAILLGRLDVYEWADAIQRACNHVTYGEIAAAANARAQSRTVTALVDHLRQHINLVVS